MTLVRYPKWQGMERLENYSPRGIAVRLFFTCWIVYTAHVATNSVREIYLALAIGDHFSTRVDEYANMHSDIFEKKGFGWHIGANPGASMLGAVPYFLSRPALDPIVAAVNHARAANGQKDPPTYYSPWPMAREFYQEAWRRGLDVKLGLAAIVMQMFCMAPISALGAVSMFYLLREILGSARAGLWLALLFAFGTPVFFRTGYLNHNLMLGHFAFMGFLAMWNPGEGLRWSERARYALGGLAGGLAVLLDYSGIVMLAGLFCYAVAKAWRAGAARGAVRAAWYYGLGSLGPILLLWFYQWRSFGSPFLPGQHWMPPVEGIEVGYRGFTWLQPDLMGRLLVDYRYGLFVTCPLLLLALLAPWWNRGQRRLIPARELAVLLLIPAGLWLFCSGIVYTRLQFNTGLRYLAPLLPFLFVPAAIVLYRMPRRLAAFISIAAVAQAWSMAMYRDVERGWGVLDPVLQVFIGGFQLPLLTVLSRLSGQYGDYSSMGVSPLPIFAVLGAVIFVIWSRRFDQPIRNAPSMAAKHFLSETAKDDARFTVDVVIPVLNEAHVLQKSVETLLAFLRSSLRYRWQIVIVDNGSTDGTQAVAAELTAAHPEVTFLRLASRGRGRALRYAWLQSKADIVCYMDVDLSTHLSHIPELIGAIARDGYDIATGSRLLPESRTTRSLKREIVSRLYNLLLKVALSVRFSDAQCGFKAVSRNAVETIVPQIEDQSWFFDTELLALAENQGYRIKDIPVVWVEDDDSRVKILQTGWEDIKGVVRLRRRGWSRHPAAEPVASTDQRQR